MTNVLYILAGSIVVAPGVARHGTTFSTSARRWYVQPLASAPGHQYASAWDSKCLLLIRGTVLLHMYVLVMGVHGLSAPGRHE